MARSNSSGTLKFIGAAAVAVVGGAAIGMLLTRPTSPHAADQAPQQTVPVVSTPAVSAPPPAVHPRTANGNYIAPGAPRIVIREESAPVLRHVNPPAPADTEASQEAAPVVQSVPAEKTPDSAETGGDSSSAPSRRVRTREAAPASDAAPAPADGTPPAPPAAPADPDFERVVKPGDAEAGQEGASKAQFRVQAGTYTDESSARSVADQLRSQGFSASTRTEREGSRTTYKVQAGAYRSKNGANKAAEDLQKKGFPAYVAPVAP